MNLHEAREMTKKGTLQTQAFDDAEVDYAIQATLHDLQNYAKVVWAKTDVSLSASITTVDLTGTSGLADLTPEMFQYARIGNDRVERVDYHWLRRRLKAQPNLTGQPTHMAFELFTVVHLFPKTDQAYTMPVVHNPALTSWTPGQPDNVAINIPDRYIREALWTGCAARLVYGEATNNPWPVTGWQLYLRYRDEMKVMAAMDAGLPAPNPYAAAVPAQAS